MDDSRPVVRDEGSRVVQGCLFGSVMLFVLLLITILFLAYQRFREHTISPSRAPAASRIVAPRGAAYYGPVRFAFRDPGSVGTAATDDGDSMLIALSPVNRCHKGVHGGQPGGIG